MAKSTASAARVARLVEALGNDIVFGAYPQGARLKLVDLQARYGASAFEVRQALPELKARRLVEHVVNAGFRVARPDEGERAQMREVRVLLETAAARATVGRASPADVARLRGLALRFERAVARGDRAALIASNDAFHAGLYALAGNAVLAGLIGELRERDTSGTTGRWRSAEGLREASADHLAIVEALGAGDAGRLERLVAAHIRAF